MSGFRRIHWATGPHTWGVRGAPLGRRGRNGGGRSRMGRNRNGGGRERLGRHRKEVGGGVGGRGQP